MTDHVHANLDRMRWLTAQVRQAATTMSEGRSDLPGRPGAQDVEIDSGPAAAFGNTSGAAACHAAWWSAEVRARSAYDNQATMLASDVDKLGDVVACFEQNDDESADRIVAAGRGLNVFTTHVHSERSHQRGDAADQERSRQIGTAADHVTDAVGPTVFTGDLNATRTSDTNSADAISALVERDGYTDAGAAAGGTSPSGHRIDYVFTSPGIRTPASAERVEGAPSDHDGIAVDVDVPPDW